MQFLLAILGVAMLVTLLVDVSLTTFSEGVGPISRRVGLALGRLVLILHWRCNSRRIITKAGVIVVYGVMLTWTLLLWFGWTLVFISSPDSILPTTSVSERPDLWSHLYFTGYTISTLGLGDFRPNGHFWELCTVVAAGSGFLLLSLAIAYIVPVVQAATQKRQLALNIWSLGRDPGDIIIRAWNGVDTTALAPHLVSLVSMLALLGESHVTYPILHFFHSSKRSSSLAPNIAVLDEALTILECGLQKGCSLDLPSLGAAREAITEYLATLKPALIATTDTDPPPPHLGSLRDMGVPVVEDEFFQSALSGLSDRRRLLLTVVRNEGWTWNAVWPQEDKAATPSTRTSA